MTEDSKTLFYMKRSAAGAVKKALYKIVNEIPLTIDQAYESLVFFFVDEDVIDAWTQLLNKLKVDQVHQEQGMYLPESTRKKFIRYLTIQSSKLFTEKFDTTSRLLIRGATDMDDKLNWFLKWPQCIISNFKETGCYGCIEGVPRSGKTSIACTFMPMFNEYYNFDILTNIKIKNAPDYIFYVKKLSDLVKLMDERKDWICVLDETATFAYKKLALKTENIDFENLGRFIGKMGGRLLMISHSFEMDIPTQLQTWMSERYKKLDKETMRIDLAGANYKAHKIIEGVPDTILEFITEDITSLQFDISIYRMLQRIQDGVSVPVALDEQLSYKQEQLDNKQEKENNITIQKRIKELGCIIGSGIKGDEHKKVMAEYNRLKNTL